MKKEVLTQVTSALPITGLVIFFAVFVGLLIWVSLKENRKKFSNAKLVPFQDGSEHE